MSRSSPRTPKNLREQIGSAIWLLIVLVQHTPTDWTGSEPAWVAGGNVISDSELVKRLECSLTALSGWRRRLRNLGLMGWLLSPGNGRAYWAAGVSRVFAEPQATEQPSETKTNKPNRAAAATVWKAVEERSIALTGKVIEDLDPAEGLRLASALAESSKNPSGLPVSEC